MSSINDCIKFDLDIKDKNIVFYDNFYKFFNGVQYKVYEALLKQPACPILRLFEFHQDGQAKDPRSLYYCRCQPSDCHQTVQAEDSVPRLSTQID